MSLVTVNPAVANGTVIQNTHVNDLASALSGQFVGRNTSGVVTAGQDLGTALYPWGTITATGLILNGQTLEALAVPATRVISGAFVNSFITYPTYLAPSGPGGVVSLLGTTTPLRCSVQGSNLTVGADDTFSSLTLAPSSNNTCLVNDSDCTAQFETKLLGEQEVVINNKTKAPEITVDAMGSNITSRVGTWQWFRLAHSSDVEYIYAFVASSTKLTKVRRAAATPDITGPVRLLVSDNDVITLMQGTWLFLNRVSETTYTKLTTGMAPWLFSPVPLDGYISAPSTDVPEMVPVTGAFMQNATDGKWYQWSGSAWVEKTAVLIGVAICDSADCVVAVPEPFYRRRSNEMEFNFSLFNAKTVKAAIGSYAIVNGVRVEAKFSEFIWSGDAPVLAATSSSTDIYLYLNEFGNCFMSFEPPRKNDGVGAEYHPFNTARCVGVATGTSMTGLSSVRVWSRPSPGIGYIATYRVSAASSQAITGLTAGKRYRVVYSLLQNTSAGELRVRFNNDSGSTYKHSVWFSSSGGNFTYNGSATYGILSGGGSVEVGEQILGSFEFCTRPSDDTRVQLNGTSSFIRTSSVDQITNTISAFYDGAASVTEVDLLTSAGTFTGFISIYRID